MRSGFQRLPGPACQRSAISYAQDGDEIVYLQRQVLGFLGILALINLIELITEVEDLAIGL
jgi:hypothetical protein